MDEKIIYKIKEEFENIPFGSSEFQIRNFIMSEPTDALKYKTALLQLSTKIKALETCNFRRMRLDLDLQELEIKLSKAPDGSIEKRRYEIDLEEKNQALNDEVKLINDAIIEVGIYNDILSKLPKFTRKEWENKQLESWTIKLKQKAATEAITTGKIETGTLETLQKIGISLGKNGNGELCFTEYKPLQLEAKEG